MAEDAGTRHFHDDGVAHDERRDEGGVGLVEGVVEGANAQHHADGAAAELGGEAAVCRARGWGLGFGVWGLGFGVWGLGG